MYDIQLKKTNPQRKFSTRVCVELKPRYQGPLYSINDGDNDDDDDDEDDDARCNNVDENKYSQRYE